MEPLRKMRGKPRAARTVFLLFSTFSGPIFPYLCRKAPVPRHFQIRLFPGQKRIPKHPSPGFSSSFQQVAKSGAFANAPLKAPQSARRNLTARFDVGPFCYSPMIRARNAPISSQAARLSGSRSSEPWNTWNMPGYTVNVQSTP